MVVTGILAFIVIRKVWQWSVPATIALIGPFIIVDSTFLVANLLKVVEGGWVPLLIAGGVGITPLRAPASHNARSRSGDTQRRPT